MANTIAKNGYRKILLNRGNKETPDYTVPSKLFVSLDENVPNVTSTTLPTLLPITDGTTNDDGSNTLTGSNGGDNSTDNITTYKEGAGQSDDTAQNLIANATSVTKEWVITGLTTNIDSSQYLGKWLYIKDQTALDKFLTSGTCLEFRYETDASNYYSVTYEAADLETGWNWIPVGIVSSLTETGTVGTLSNFRIIITTNNATDSFVAGDVVYDLLRQWESTDTFDSLIANYPALNETKLQSDHSFILTVGDANGFFITKYGVVNSDGTPIYCFESLTDGDSKSRTDQFRVSFKNIIR